MSETPTTSGPAPESEHAWVHEHLAAYLAGGLAESERARLDAHINGCPACFDAFTEARDADRALLRMLAPLAPDGGAAGGAGGGNLEEKIITHLREHSMKRWSRPMVRRTAYAAAAAVALAATGVFANYVIRQNGRFNNPLSQQLASDADQQSPELSATIARLTHALGGRKGVPVSAPRENENDGNTWQNDMRNIIPAGTQPAQRLTDEGQAPARANGTREFFAPKFAVRQDAATPLDRRAKVDQLVADAKKQYDDTNLDVADSLLAQATTLDPTNQSAKQMQQLVQDKLADRQYQSFTEPGGTSEVNQNIDSAEHHIPYADLVLRGESATELNRTANAQQGVNGVLNYSGGDLTVASGTITANGGELALNAQNQSPGTIAGKERNGAAGSNEPPAWGAPNRTATDFFGNAVAFGPQAGTNYTSAPGAVTDLVSGVQKNANVAPPRMDLASLAGGSSQSFGNGGSGGFGGGGFGGPGAQGRQQLAAGDSAAPTGDHLFDEEKAAKTRDKNAPAAKGADAEAQKTVPVFGDVPELGKALKRDGDKSVASAESIATLTPPTPHEPAKPAAATAPAPGASAAPPTTTAPAIAIANQLKIIRNGTIEFEVRNFDDAYSSVAKIVLDEGGFVSSTSSDKLPNGHVRGTITVRVPPDHLDRFLLSLRALGDLKSQQISANDVTKEYTDTDSELRGLRTMETRLLDLIKNGKGEVKDLIEAETKLGETRIQIEKLEGQLKYYDNLVGMATITITAYEKDIQTPTAASVQETMGINVETEEVEAQYQAARKILDDAKGHIIESQLNNTDGEHIAAHIVAEVPPDKADFVANQLRQLGKVTSFGRDRKQTSSGGTGPVPPGVQVEQKDTRVTMDLFNLANLAPRETTVLRIAVPDVEEAYRLALAQLRRDVPEAGGAGAAAAGAGETPHPEGHIISSNLTGQKPDQMSADVRAEIRADQADAFLAAIRNSGEVLTSSVAANPDTAGSTAAKRGLQISFVNIAAVMPREVRTMTIAVEDVDKAYADLRTLLDKDAGAPAPPSGTQPATAALLPKTIGRVIFSNINGQQPEQKIADIRAEIRTDQEDAVTAALADAGEIMSNSLTENPDTTATTRIKRGLQVRFVNQAAVVARETISLRAVAANVPDAYQKLTDALKAIPAANLRIVSSALNESNPQDVNATLTFEVASSARPAVEKVFPAAGIDFLSRNDASSTDSSGTLKSKIRFQVDQLSSAETLPPRRTFTLGVEVDNVESAMTDLRSFANAPPSHARVAEYNVSRESSGRTTGHIVLDFPADEDVAMLSQVRDLHGVEISNQLTANTQAPDTQHFNKERVDLTLVSKAGIVQSDKGLGQSIRAALTSATGALLYSLYLVLTGVLFVLPFVLIAWPLAAFLRRRKAAA